MWSNPCFHLIAYSTQAKTSTEADSDSLPSSIISYPHSLWPCIQPPPAWESLPSLLLNSRWEAPSCQAHPASGFPILWPFYLFRLKVQHLSPAHPRGIRLCRASAKSFLLFLAFEFLPPASHQTLASPLSPLQSDPQAGTQFEWLPWVVLDKFNLQPSALFQLSAHQPPPRQTSCPPPHTLLGLRAGSGAPTGLRVVQYLKCGQSYIL